MSLLEKDFDERALQYGLADHLHTLGWVKEEDSLTGRQDDEVLIFSDLRDALISLNPLIAEDPARVEQVFAKLRAAFIAVNNDGLIATNQSFREILCGRTTLKFVGTDLDEVLRLIDFANPQNNKLRVTTEATFHVGKEKRRYDLVFWVNGIPLVVGETKSPVNPNVSWLNAATDIHNAYEAKTKPFFVPNVLSFATDGREFRYGAVGQSPEMWLNWSKTTDELMQPGLAAVMRSAELLLGPEMVLDILRTYTLYSSRATSHGAMKSKIIPRYPQVEAVDAIVARCLDPNKKQGLVWHHQGSGKTFAMAYAAAKLRLIKDLDAPTIVIVLDRLELIEQTAKEFASVGIAAVSLAESKEQLRQKLKDDARGVIITTIFRFSEAGLLNERDNIVVMVDEAHRTQEGRLGLDMREALPNAKFIGLTGTPISGNDKNTWAMFGDPDDPEGSLNHYTVERSIADGATLPIHVETKALKFIFDYEALKTAFDDFVDAEGLDEDQAGVLSAKASQLAVVLKQKEVVEGVCKDIVEHYTTKIEPLGLKAQVVAFDRATCVLYYDEITRLLGNDKAATVVMTTIKDDPQEWDKWNTTRDEEAVIKDRFRDIEDPLKIVIVTAKLLTGFDAPIEGVMYLAKPLRAHTLFQAVCRTNRRWTNPLTGQEKLHGLIVDYIGMGQDLAKAVAVKPSIPSGQDPGDVAVLMAELKDAIAATLTRFSQVDRTASAFEQIHKAQEILNTKDLRAEFTREFLECQGLFEFLWPDTALRPIEADYKFLAQIFASIVPTDNSDKLLWYRLGAKTTALVHEHLEGVILDGSKLESVAIDAEMFEKFRQAGLFPEPGISGLPAPTATEVLQKLEERLRKRIEGSDPHKVWLSLAERLELLRAQKIADASASVEFLKHLLELATDVMKAEAADDEGRLDEIKVLDPRKGALSQIFKEFAPQDTPVVIEAIVEDIDNLVSPVRGTGWQTSQPGDRRVRRELRIILGKFKLPPEGDLFSHAYNYIRENY